MMKARKTEEIMMKARKTEEIMMNERKCRACGDSSNLLDSFEYCSFCVNDYLDKRAKAKAPPAEPRYSPFRTGKRGWSMDTVNDMRFDDRQDIKRRGAYPLYDGVK